MLNFVHFVHPSQLLVSLRMMICSPLHKTSGGTQAPSASGTRPSQALQLGTRSRHEQTSSNSYAVPGTAQRPTSQIPGVQSEGSSHTSCTLNNTANDLSELAQATTPTDSISLMELPISKGVQQKRVASEALSSLELSPRCKKALKVFVKNVTDQTGISPKQLLEFIELDFPEMLVVVRAGQLQSSEQMEANDISDMEKLLTLKDFDSGLWNCLAACLLSPNLTAYVADTQRQIMDFIQGYPDLFKLPTEIFEDVELKATLAKMVTQHLSNIHGQIKLALVNSVLKGTNIRDTLAPLVNNGMEVDSSHWTRLAFLFHGQLEKELNIDITQLLEELDHGLTNDDHSSQEVDEDEDSRVDGENNDHDSVNGNDTYDGDLDAKGIPDDNFNENETILDLDSEIHWTKQHFWKYVDHNLKKTYILQVNLQDYPTSGHHKTKTIWMGAISLPAWQETIQKELIW
ncbi:hypothetical protein V8B97DRAFT_1914119 [Scleroderma yunnanense]